MKKNITSIGLVGCGKWGKYILRDLKKLGCITHVVARSSNSISNAKTYSADHIISSIEEFPDNMNGYVVAVTTSKHAEIIYQLLERNKPIYVEKPLTDNLEDARNIFAQAKDRIFVMDKWRYHSAVNELADIVKSKEFGSVISIKSRRLGWGVAHDDVDPIWVLLPHDLSIVIHILGYLPEPKMAIGYLNGNNIPVGMTAFLGESSQVSIEISSIHPTRDRSIIVQFEQATAMMPDAYSKHISICRGDGLKVNTGEPENRPIEVNMPLYDELNAFVEYLRGGKPPFSNTQDALTVVESITKLRRLANLL